jgi:hypothetical protein
MSPSILANLNFSNAAFINIGAGIVMVALTLCGMFYQARKPTQQQARCKYEPFFRQTSTSRLRVNYFVLSQFHAQLMPGPTCADSRFSTNQQSISSATGRLVARLNVWVPLYFRQWIILWFVIAPSQLTGSSNTPSRPRIRSRKSPILDLNVR